MRTTVFLVDASGTRLFDATISKEFEAVAEEAGIAEHLYEPDVIGMKTAEQLSDSLANAGMKLLDQDPTPHRQHFAGWLGKYLKACTEFPAARIEVTRIPDPPTNEKKA